jgi:hypothetical protein
MPQELTQQQLGELRDAIFANRKWKRSNFIDSSAVAI